jgi:hypothetical protein
MGTTQSSAVDEYGVNHYLPSLGCKYSAMRTEESNRILTLLKAKLSTRLSPEAISAVIGVVYGALDAEMKTNALLLQCWGAADAGDVKGIGIAIAYHGADGFDPPLLKRFLELGGVLPEVLEEPPTTTLDRNT